MKLHKLAENYVAEYVLVEKLYLLLLWVRVNCWLCLLQ